MTKQEQIAEMAVLGCVRNPRAHTTEECLKCEFSDGCCNAYRHAEALYNAGYQKAEEVRKETAKEIFYRVVNICRKEIDFQDGTINTQLEPLYFGIINGCDFVMDEVKRLAKQYSVEVEE